ncbi:PLAC8 family-domain-containing protein [Lactifluus volemus]|nr:PLAC8 family-domain-containing protein [Lactifluus volemus]
MTAGGNRNALNREVASDGTRDWSFGLCSFFGACGIFCWSFWCPCVVYGKTKQRLHNLQAQGTPLPGGGDAINSDCLVYGCLTAWGYGWILQIGNRGSIRGRYNIRGNGCTDCLVACCCQVCSLTQDRREIEAEEHSF